MKKLIFICVLFMAFAVKSFAYTGYGSYTLSEEGSRSETIAMYCQSAGGDMGAMNPGFVEVLFYSMDEYFHVRFDYPDYGSFHWIHPISVCQLNIVNYQYLGTPSGVNLSWTD